MTYISIEIGLSTTLEILHYLIQLWQQYETTPVKEAMHVRPDYERCVRLRHELRTHVARRCDTALTTEDIKAGVDVQGSPTQTPRKF
jgi:hypothetical protein